MGSGTGVQDLTCTKVNNLPGSAGDPKRSCYHSFRIHLLTLPSLEAAQGSPLRQGPCSFHCIERGPQQHNGGRRELSRCPPHSSSESQPPGYCGELLSSPPVSPSSNPRELRKKYSSASYRGGHYDYFDRSTALSHSPCMAHFQLRFRCAQGRGDLGLPKMRE